MGDEEKGVEFTRLVTEHTRALLRYVYRRLSDSASCEDVVAETFLIAWRRWDVLPARERELPWLYGIAFRVLSNQRRSRDRRDRLFTRISRERSDQNDDVDTVDVASIRGALDRLKESDRELLQLVYWEELTYREIAQAIGISENAVGIRITRAKSKLRGFLSPSGDGVDDYLALEDGADS